jgi:hypothetical protein
VISSASSSSRAACALLAVALAACAHGQKPVRQVRLAVFPPVILASGSVPMQELRRLVEDSLRKQRFEVVELAAMEMFLARHRVRYTGGLERETAIAASSELGVEGVVITSIEAYQASPPRLSVTQRLVSTGEAPAIVWIDGASRSGDESPGFLDLGIVTDPGRLATSMFRDLAASLAAFRDGAGPRASGCATAGRFAPRNSFRAPALGSGAIRRVAVLPFLNETQRRGAGEALALEFVRQLEATGTFKVVEPGLVREELLRYRIVMESGVSLDTARVVTELLRTDLVLTGYVRDYDDGSIPKVDFTVLLLDNANSEVLWQSTSHNQGNDGVFFFDAGSVGTAAGLACRMAREVVVAINAQR